ncbi:DUF202 domain-containing protein [Nocardioides pacificus]
MSDPVAPGAAPTRAGAPAGAEGLANERTALAWQRTALSLMAACAIMARLTFADLGGAAFVPLGLALLLAGWVFVESRGRYAHDAGLRPRPRRRSGRAPTTLAVATVLLGATELGALVLR